MSDRVLSDYYAAFNRGDSAAMLALREAAESRSEAVRAAAREALAPADAAPQSAFGTAG